MRARSLTALLAVAALAFAGPTGAGGPTPVKDGRYAGGAKRLFVLFDVTNRTIPFVRVDSEKLSSCAVDGPGVFDLETVDGNGRFSLKDSATFPDNTIKVSGRFVSATRVKGKIKWTTADDCPAGVYEFSFRADRYASAG